MKFLNLYLLSTIVSRVRPTLLPTKKICRDCKYFIGDELECGKFGDQNIVSGKVSYPSARSTRENDKQCGENAIHFEKNHFKILTVPYYFLKSNWPLILPTGFFSIYFFIIGALINNKS
jgi:hypothetical protein